MSVRKILAGMLSLAMVSPAWSGGKPIGSISSAIDATAGNMKLTPGSTIFPGDEIWVAANGGARIAFTGGAQAEVLGGSSVRLTTAGNQILLVVDHGQASFHSSGSEGITARVAGATVQPAEKSQTTAVMQSLSETHAIVAAQKGALLVTTANDGKVYLVPEGQAADLSTADDPQQDGNSQGSKKDKKAVIWTVVIVGGGTALAAYLLSLHQTKLSTTQLQNEISPDKLN